MLNLALPLSRCLRRVLRTHLQYLLLLARMMRQQRCRERQLERQREKQEGDIKTHAMPPIGRVTQLVPKADHGFITLEDGQEVYFHRHAVANEGFDRLSIGEAVTLVLSEGHEGPQASLIRPLPHNPGA